jgi:FkbM family methyltransferase
MTVLDIGAHHGLYTVLASRMVKPGGRVIAFEPSPRERARLESHVRLNLCRNVTVEGIALGETQDQEELFLADSSGSMLNSLRPPASIRVARRVRVRVARLDELLETKGISQVDFVKMDVEGGELPVLRGAERLLARRPRPLILTEVSECRTHAWGYAARDIVAFLEQRRFSWYAVGPAGTLQRLEEMDATYDENLLAVPEEYAGELPSA